MFLESPSSSHTNPALSPLIATETSDTEITTTEIIKRRDVGPYGIRSEYCIRKIICPLGVPETPKGKGTLPGRLGLNNPDPFLTPSLLSLTQLSINLFVLPIPPHTHTHTHILPPYLYSLKHTHYTPSLSQTPTLLLSLSHPETHTPQRKGLRSSALRPKKPEPTKQTGPVVIETWVAEEELDLWEIRAFSERSEGKGCQGGVTVHGG